MCCWINLVDLGKNKRNYTAKNGGCEADRRTHYWRMIFHCNVKCSQTNSKIGCIWRRTEVYVSFVLAIQLCGYCGVHLKIESFVPTEVRWVGRPCESERLLVVESVGCEAGRVVASELNKILNRRRTYRNGGQQTRVQCGNCERWRASRDRSIWVSSQSWRQYSCVNAHIGYRSWWSYKSQSGAWCSSHKWWQVAWA